MPTTSMIETALSAAGSFPTVPAAVTAGERLVELALVVGVPCAVAILVMSIAARWGLPSRAAWATSVGLAYLAGQLALAARAGVAAALDTLRSPLEAHQWLPWAVLLALAIALWSACGPVVARWLGIAAAVLLAVGLPARLLATSVYVRFEWTGGEKLAYLLMLAASLGLVWLLLEAAGDDRQPVVRGMLLVWVAAGVAIALVLSGSIVYGELSAVVAAALTGALLAGVAGGASAGVAGAAGVLTCSLGGLILLGHFYAELEPINATLLLLALVAGGGRLPANLPGTWAWQSLLRAGLCLVPLVTAIAAAYQATSGGPTAPY